MAMQDSYSVAQWDSHITSFVECRSCTKPGMTFFLCHLLSKLFNEAWVQLKSLGNSSQGIMLQKLLVITDSYPFWFYLDDFI